MNNRYRSWHFIIATGFPLFFILHGVNEQFGLVRHSIIGGLATYYLVVSISISFLAKWLMKEYARATTFMFLLLCVFFFFGAIKDSIKGWPVVPQYRFFIPIVVAFILITGAYIRRTRNKMNRAAIFIRTLVAIFLIVEMMSLIYNVTTHKERQRDLGDIDHTLIKNARIPQNAVKPIIVWVVMDEYSGASALRRRWNYVNPFDSILRTRNFFVADSARSPYNYTHYSLVSTLDVAYLSTLKDSAIIGYRDIVRGNISLQNTNVIRFLENSGYNIVNHTIYNVKGHPTEAHEYFVNADWKLIDNQTMPGRIGQDIGWMFTDLRHRLNTGDATATATGLAAEALYRQELLNKGLRATSTAVKSGRPTMLMFHYMLTHEPFLYNDDGSIDVSVGFGMYPDRYLSSIKYANKALTGFIDSLQQILKGKEAVIIIQGDHGYKFDEGDPLYKQEGCSILYAVYCSDLQYPGWSSSINSVNGFRLVFNKYFLTNFPMLENRSYDLLYR